MDYFLMDQVEHLNINKIDINTTPEATICKIENLKEVNGIDYIMKEHIISDRLKSLFELYHIQKDWKPFVYIEAAGTGQETFWHLENKEFKLTDVDFHNDSMISAVKKIGCNAPRLFQIKSKNGLSSIVVHLSIVESIMRRHILGLQLNRLCDQSIPYF